jgi:hypothetical protein
MTHPCMSRSTHPHPLSWCVPSSLDSPVSKMNPSTEGCVTWLAAEKFTKGDIISPFVAFTSIRFFKRCFTKLSGAAGSEIWFSTVFTAVCFDDSLSRHIVVVVVVVLLRVDSIGNLSTTDNVVVGQCNGHFSTANSRNGGEPHII